MTLTEPYVLSVPDSGDRYYVLNVFNMYQEIEHYIGRQTTGTKAGRYVTVPPGRANKLPDGIAELPVTTDKVWLWGRVNIKQGEPKAPVLTRQKKFCLRRSASSAPRATARRLVRVLDQGPISLVSIGR